MNQAGPQAAAARLLDSAGLTAGAGLRRLAGGGNNQVFELGGRDGRYLMKLYFQHPGDPRDRLASEYQFLRYAWAAGLRRLPRPVAQDPEGRAALYQFLEGRRPLAGEVDRQAVAQALEFFLALNRNRHDARAQALPPASEACFSLRDHLACVERRLMRLKALEPGEPLRAQARELATGPLVQAWGRTRAAVLAGAARLGWSMDEPLAQEERRLSPSDFGFHNALMAPDGRLSFIDFEYAGWDDPVKAVCDFFSAPDPAAPRRHFAWFAAGALAGLPRPDWHQERARLVWPVHWLKWCCLILGEFLCMENRRRGFAGLGPASDPARLAGQLVKARAALAALPQATME